MTDSADWRSGKEEQLERLGEYIASGETRESITCSEARTAWFAMSRRMYVGDDPEPDIPLDYESGVHIGGCPTPECQRLATFYFEVLRLSQPEDSESLSQQIDKLELQTIVSSN